MEVYKNLNVNNIDDGEKWVAINESEGYELSCYGRVKLIRPFGGSYIKVLSVNSGYSYVGFSKENNTKHFRVCRLVGKYFVPNPENKPHINHIDGNKRNDSYTNLVWSTASENMAHAYKLGLKLPTRAISGKVN